MKMKKYIAPTMLEAMKEIRKELGPDAVILNSQEIQQGGILGLFKKKRIEVVAALDSVPKQRKLEEKRMVQEKKLDHFLPQRANNESAIVLSELKQLKKMMEYQAEKVNQYPIQYQEMYQHLLYHEISSTIARQIIDALIARHEAAEITADMDTVKRDTKELINEMLQDIPFNSIAYEKKVIQFVGPTGVGKTTTIAKIAANMILKDHKKVAFITTDTYRIAAIDQLKTYAKILNIPLEVAYSIPDYKRAVEKFHDYDVILVDTAGRNFRDEKYVRELEKSVAMQVAMDTYVVLSLTAKPQDIIEIYKQFRHLSVKEVIFTKLDETRQYGSMLNVVIDNQIGVAYVTNGQDVPDDLMKVSTERIAELLVGDFGDA
ncbi:flagellar biosynthesis protein FlhF [Oceanobacillus chungangensis]|uniref:Flagellar biosynthesis protein FlhF n=1 Tax=Oceanobacillus chungangensis TaxID=1229152 RepID=A0A3D8PRC7_9BACI|nr:flagellar biosynthesis protein FlhF [Oceanobacillus chungangensis]RDW17818.1 flagellar biosynthesis protein FlhF [Oceanobacillus chungangensis]